MIIPWDNLDTDTLDNLIEHFVLREGTDYGEEEVLMAVKIEQVRQQLQSGDACIIYSEEDDSIDIQLKAT